MGWCFAIVNGKLAEIFFDQKKRQKVFLGHAYVSEDEYNTKRERTWIKKDTQKCKFSYRKGIYRDKMGNSYKCIDFDHDPKNFLSQDQVLVQSKQA